MSDRLEVAYPSNFYAYQTPVVLDYVAALGGNAPPVPRGAPFNYIDLGCGDGFTIVLLAAIHPEARFVGVDLEAQHVARGRALAAAGGLANVTFVEADFSDWRRLDLPGAHYVALHGVWAWISDAARGAVVALLSEKVLPGGFVYLGYNAMPGWAPAAPLRQFFLDWARGHADPLEGVAATLKQLQLLKTRGAEFFQHNPVAASLLDEWAKRDLRYVAHEIFSPHWSPQPFAAVERAMAAAGLAFAGSADLAKNFPQASLKPAFAQLVAGERDRIRGETLRDYLGNTRFRRDLFVKGGAALDPAEFETRPFGLRMPLAEAAPVVPLPVGRMDVSGEPFQSIRRALAQGSKSIAELAAMLKAPKPAVLEAVQALTLGWQVAPFAAATRSAPAPKDWRVAHRINEHLLAHPVTQDGFELLAAPATGSALALPKAVADTLRKKGEAPEGRLSKWLELGLIAPG